MIKNKIKCQWCHSNKIRIEKCVKKHVSYYCINPDCKFKGKEWGQAYFLK